MFQVIVSINQFPINCCGTRVTGYGVGEFRVWCLVSCRLRGTNWNRKQNISFSSDRMASEDMRGGKPFWKSPRQLLAGAGWPTPDSFPHNL